MEDLPPGFRFYPTEEELVSFYLRNKLEGSRQDLDRLMNRVIPVVDIYEFNPWDLRPGELCHDDPEQWFYFIPIQEREARGGRPNRLTTSGYWKATGSPGYVYSAGNTIIGVKRTMVFYIGRAPTGRKTEWKMNEYKAIDSATTTPTLRHEFSLCRVYKKLKSMRAFDRRPSGVVIAQHQHDASQGGIQATTSNTRNHPAPVERTSSPETSSSGDHPQHHGHPSQTGESSNWKMEVDNELLWDWEK